MSTRFHKSSLTHLAAAHLASRSRRSRRSRSGLVFQILLALWRPLRAEHVPSQFLPSYHNVICWMWLHGYTLN